jgi:hypothetical protein
MMFYIPNCDVHRIDREDGHKGGTSFAVKKNIPHTCVGLPPFPSVEKNKGLHTDWKQ